ncbi:ubiquinone/menaquinone biosynthesis methyltransferase UbiE [Halosimplex carlsbadense 2-9-1]|uniref:Ubiquinone/menaquinone biosynthesis methyltransferase UbiE n=1 Tax=Halosimplex carlsbadense 2-9-1 TaxID=797114 RepID=M0CJP9_9EURY|nr:class I SAM-dependent methyltransferase [Halosimplex carlsbadense]ELZ23466.1 ubiquinone/menaquinone biosynthesis methyltransferase UbiE [Halosimplex carlsbadense 2-9-1]
MDERVRRTVETYERVADDYADRHGDRSVVADIVEAFVTAVDATGADPGTRGGEPDPTGPPRVLDVGCGPGWESAAFTEAGFDTVPFDLTRSFLDRARERVPDGAPVRGDMRTLPFADDGFDGLWACASLLHVPERDVSATLAEFERVLAQGGVALVSLKAAGGPGEGVDASPYDEDRRHFERYDPGRARHLFEAAGFEVVSVATDGGGGDGTGGDDAGDAWVAVTARASRSP